MKDARLLERTPNRLILDAETAADLMTSRVQTIPETMTVKEAVAFLSTHGFSAAPVVDGAGKPVGVLSRTDLVKHDYEKVEYIHEESEDLHLRHKLVTRWGEQLPRGYHVETADDTPVRQIMTPVVYSVVPDTPADTVVDALLTFEVHRLFVINASGAVIGVISAFDILRRLCK